MRPMPGVRAGARSGPDRRRIAGGTGSGCRLVAELGSESGASPRSRWGLRERRRRGTLDRRRADHRVRGAADGCADPLSGEPIGADQVDLTARFCRTASRIGAAADRSSVHRGGGGDFSGTLVNRGARPDKAGASVRIGMPSGMILTVDRGGGVSQERDGVGRAHSGAFYRTARRLFDGRVYVPARG